MNSFEQHILQCLAESPRGLSMAQMWKMQPWRLKFNIFSSGLYAAAFRLENAGQIKGLWVDGPYPRRKIYYLVAPHG